MYKNLTLESNSSLKRFSHSRRFEIAAKLLEIESCDEFLDYGTGDGHFLFLIRAQLKIIKRVVGYEPIDSQFAQLKEFSEKAYGSEVEIYKDPPKGELFSKISCLEVLEHMTLENQKALLNQIRALMTDDGLFLLSVPIEVGISGLMKNIARILLRQTHPETTVENIIKSTFSMPINRPNQPYIYTHIGFNHKELEKIFIDVGLRIENKYYSPLPLLKNIINSQIFYLLRKI